jgi:hypothetical protein
VLFSFFVTHWGPSSCAHVIEMIIVSSRNVAISSTTKAEPIDIAAFGSVTKITCVAFGPKTVRFPPS